MIEEKTIESKEEPIYREKITVNRRGDQKRTLVRNLPKVGRNESCPCGSGKKYKKCCGRDGTDTDDTLGEGLRLSKFANNNCKICLGKGHLGFVISEGRRFVQLCEEPGCARQKLKEYTAYKRLEALEKAGKESHSKVKDRDNDEGRTEDSDREREESQSEGVGGDLPIESKREPETENPERPPDSDGNEDNTLPGEGSF